MICIVSYKNKNYFETKNKEEISYGNKNLTIEALLDYKPKKKQDESYRYVNILVM